jgi:flagellar biosynthesis/type III secretory pathway protein FliH
MTLKLEPLVLTQPLRDVRRIDPSVIAAENQRRQEADLKASYDKGKRDGEKALSEQLLQQRAEILQLQNGVLESLRQSVKKVVADSEDTLVALTLEIAQKLVGSLAITPEMVESSVKDALGQIEQSTRIKVLLHPEDLSLLQKIDSALLPQAGSQSAMQVQSSSDVTRGGCIVETDFGTIDARRETKLEMIKRSLKP